jgi:hypothetical protein
MPYREMVLSEKKSTWGWTKFMGQFILILSLVFDCFEVICGFRTKEKGIDIAFPLFIELIGQGGSSFRDNSNYTI